MYVTQGGVNGINRLGKEFLTAYLYGEDLGRRLRVIQIRL